MEESTGSNSARVMSPTSVNKRVTRHSSPPLGAEGVPRGALAEGSGFGHAEPVCSVSPSLFPGHRSVTENVPQECARCFCALENTMALLGAHHPTRVPRYRFMFHTWEQASALLCVDGRG